METIRVDDLARELGVSDNVVLSTASALGMFGRGKESTLSKQEAGRVREYIHNPHDKVTIHELARELSIRGRSVREFTDALGIPTRDDLEILTVPQADRVREYFRKLPKSQADQFVLIRINDLARELEFKSKAILAMLPYNRCHGEEDS